jgi:hypothetical protein
MEVVDSQKLEHCHEINTRFYGGGFLETNSVQTRLCVTEDSTKVSTDMDKQQTFSMVTARLYMWPFS